jgi:hypothetical protein
LNISLNFSAKIIPLAAEGMANDILGITTKHAFLQLKIDKGY